jgi:hypothetical protein
MLPKAQTNKAVDGELATRDELSPIVGFPVAIRQHIYSNFAL